VIQPNITHLPCDLNQQKKRDEARKDSLARAVMWRSGKRTLLDRLLRRTAPALDVTAESARHADGEDVFHAFSV
jgi:hypothetical protein